MLMSELNELDNRINNGLYKKGARNSTDKRINPFYDPRHIKTKWNPDNEDLIEDFEFFIQWDFDEKRNQDTVERKKKNV